MARYKLAMPISDPFWQACARHQSRTTARQPISLYLCDGCCVELVEDCFNQRPPIYHGEPERGYCGLCNKLKVVAQRQWFICGICANVVRAYSKSRAATKFVRDYWSKHVSPHSPQLQLVETDAVKIEPYIIGRRSARSKLGVTADLDFTVIEIDDAKDRPLALIEMKTGPGSVESMREFQLDLNDYVDIASAVRGTGLPAYLVHVQVDTEIIPPTSRSVAVDMWWTDVLTLRQGFVRLAKRRDESKVAGYFSTSVFKAAALLATEFETHGYELLMENLAGELPDLPA